MESLVEHIHTAQIAELWVAIKSEHSRWWSGLAIMSGALLVLMSLLYIEVVGRLHKLQKALYSLEVLKKQDVKWLVQEDPETVRRAIKAVKLWNKVGGAQLPVEDQVWTSVVPHGWVKPPRQWDR